MVTGDHEITARKIAQDVGLADDLDTDVCEAQELAEGPEPAGKSRLLACNVFARIPPHDKLNLVKLHQDAGAVVAMTGNGVNDAPALQKADIGIAMGLRETQVAAEASDVNLRDDRFGSIVEAMREGRIIYGNIRAFIRHLFTCNLSEVLVVAVGTISGMSMPLLPLLVLFLNLVTDIFPAIALGLGEGSGDEMCTPPRRKREPLATRRGSAEIILDGALICLGTIGAYLIALEYLETGTATTVAFPSICMVQLVFVLALYGPRERLLSSHITRNRYVWIAVALNTALMLDSVYLPPLAMALRLTPPDVSGWLLAATASVVPTAPIWARRQLTRTLPVRHSD